jgi:hypothetical protein
MTEESEDHDQRFKVLLETFFSDFVQIVAPNHAARLSLERTEFLKQEVYTDVPQGEKRYLDLVAKVPDLNNQEELVLVHVEVEGQFRSGFSSRIWRYYLQLQLRHSLPILPIVVFLKGGPPGLQQAARRELFFEEEITLFRYYSLGLSSAEAEAYLARPEPLAWALAALMSFNGSEAQHKLDCMKRLSGNQLDPARQFLLLDCIQTYIPLAGQSLEEYTQLVETLPQEETKTMELWWSERLKLEGEAKGEAKGEARGEAKGKVNALLQLLALRKLPITNEQKTKIETCLDLAQLDIWFAQAFSAKSASTLFAASPTAPKKTTKK